MLDTGCMIHYKKISNVEGVERNKKIFKQIHKVVVSQSDTIGKIELNPSSVLSIKSANSRNDIQ